MKMFDKMFNFLTDTTSVSSLPETQNITFEPQRFVEMLEYMGKGMLAIFVLIGVIVLVTMLINKVFSKKEEK